MSRAKLKAPVESGAILVDPPLDVIEATLARNRATLDGWYHDFQGRTADRVRAMTRAIALAPPAGAPPSALRSAPLIVTGHQPELFHPGVWIKNFASHAIARGRGGVSLHLVVDNDTVKGTTLRVPTGTPTEPSIVHLPFDRWQGEIPFEEYEVADEAAFTSFGERVIAAMRSLGIVPLAREFWALAVEAGRSSRRLSDRIAAARRQIEASWGCNNLELPLSRLCESDGFRWFACHVLAQLPRFRDDYNAALDEYRRRNRIRSHSHPAASLARDGDWLESPFRVWTSWTPRRRGLFARQVGHEMELTDRAGWTATLPLAPDREACCAVEALADLARRGIKIRTRALTTTIFVRLLLADLFIHGIGGARYDELADEIMRRFFQLVPPRFLTLTGTLHLPIAPSGVTPNQARSLGRRLRDLAYNADRMIPEAALRSDEIAGLIERKREFTRAEPTSRAQRRLRFQAIRHINEQLAPAVARLKADAAERLRAVQAGLAANAILRDRDWSFCLHPEERLRGFVERFV